jgi:hypothetical protein
MSLATVLRFHVTENLFHVATAAGKRWFSARAALNTLTHLAIPSKSRVRRVSGVGGGGGGDFLLNVFHI